MLVYPVGIIGKPDDGAVPVGMIGLMIADEAEVPVGKNPVPDGIMEDEVLFQYPDGLLE